MKLAFWKKDETALPDLNNAFSRSELGLKDSTGLDLSAQFEPNAMQAQLPPAPPQFTTQNFNTFSPPQPAPPMQYAEDTTNHTVGKDLEIIAAKLDTIRAQLEMLNTRVANLEHTNQGQPKRPWY